MLKYIFTSAIFFVVFSYGIVAAPVVYALDLGDAGSMLNDSAEGTGIGANTPQGDLASVIAIGLRFILSLLGTIMFGYMVYAGFLWMTAQGESEKIESAKGMMINTVIGFLVVVSAWAITYLVQSRFQ